MLAFVPRGTFHLLTGEGELTSYKFNHKVIDHVFCKTCGIKPFAFGVDPSSGAATAAINVRCLDGVDPEALQTHHYDGRAQ